jgi:hypothetical protein
MSVKGDQGSRDSGLSAAVRRFPAHSLEIERMTTSDEDFRSLCDDLGAAEAALLAIDQLPQALRGERRSECKSWIESLTDEIEDALRRKKVITLGVKRAPPTEW